MKHLLNYYNDVTNFLILKRKDEKSRRTILESHLKLMAYCYDYERIKAEIGKCRENEDYYNFLINLVKKDYLELKNKLRNNDFYKQVTFNDIKA